MLKKICDHPALLSERMADEVGAAGAHCCASAGLLCLLQAVQMPVRQTAVLSREEHVGIGCCELYAKLCEAPLCFSLEPRLVAR